MNKIPQTFNNLLFTNFPHGTDSTYGMVRVEECSIAEFKSLQAKYQYNILENKNLIKLALIHSIHGNYVIRNESQLDETIENELAFDYDDSSINFEDLSIKNKLKYWNTISLDYLELSNSVQSIENYEELVLDSNSVLYTLDEMIDKIDMPDIKDIVAYPVEKLIPPKYQTYHLIVNNGVITSFVDCRIDITTNKGWIELYRYDYINSKEIYVTSFLIEMMEKNNTTLTL